MSAATSRPPKLSQKGPSTPTKGVKSPSSKGSPAPGTPSKRTPQKLGSKAKEQASPAEEKVEQSPKAAPQTPKSGKKGRQSEQRVPKSPLPQKDEEPEEQEENEEEDQLQQQGIDMEDNEGGESEGGQANGDLEEAEPEPVSEEESGEEPEEEPEEQKPKPKEQRELPKEDQSQASGSGSRSFFGRAKGLANKASSAQSLAGGVKDTVQDTAKKGKDTLGDNLPVDLSILKGLEVGEGGKVLGQDGNPLGRVVEGEPEDLVGQTIGDNGEILDEDGDLVGRVEVLPDAAQGVTDKAKEIPDQAKDTAEKAKDSLPSLADLEGLPVSPGGEIKDNEGNVLAKLVEGDPEDLEGYTLNGEGEIVDEDGDAIGRAELVPQEAKQAVEDKADEAKETVEDQAHDVGDKAAETQEGVEQTADEASATAPSVPDLSILNEREVNDKGQVLDDEGKVIGTLESGNASEAAGNIVNQRGLVVDDDGNIVGKVGLADAGGETEEAEEELPPLSSLEGMKCNKQGRIVREDGTPVGELTEGDPKKLAKLGVQLDDQGQFWDNRGNVIGKAKTIPVQEPEEEAPFSGLDGLIVVEDGWVEDENENRVGKLVDGDAKKLVGRAVDEDGDVLDKRGNVVGHAERWEEPEEPEPEKPDLSIVKDLTPNKAGNVIGPEQVPIARVVEGNPKELAGKKLDGEGQIWNDAGKVIGRVELIPEDERETKPEGPFAGLEGLVVNKEGFVEDEEGSIVGKVVEGDPKKLRGRAVDEDGDIVDKYGNVKGRVEPYEPPEEEVPEEDLSSLAGKIVNKAGNVVDEHGTIFGRITSGDAKKLAGKKVDGQGQIWSDDGKVIGKVELIPGDEQERPEGPFYGFEGLVVGKDGVVTDASGKIVGRVTQGDGKKLEGRKVDEDGDILDKSGNSIGKAERWEPEEKKRNVNPMSGRKVNKEGDVHDADGNLIGKLTEGNLKNLIGKEIDDNGYVVDNDGNKIGECTLIENLPDEEGPSPEELEKQKKAEQDKELAQKMTNIIQQTLSQIQPVCKMITEHIEKADRTPKEELDEEKLVQEVKPLIEEGGRMLQECNGAIRALDPDGRIAATAKARAAQRDATPEEYQLADVLKELTETVVKTIDNARKRIADMPHAKKKLNPLWALLSEPLFQIIAAVGLLLTGVLGLVGRLLEGLGLGPLVHGLLGGLGIDRLLEGLGIGSITEALGLGGKKK
ncbi:LEA domain protein [Paecilomyces variotii No. 5]|uniref:LEA domain protein n=1 Tax=Byssochlamys spectabilis (strain No. 5 / NBRC 109023) TaxID=1356009 RepID=V5HWH5_BYSSN|nr:LEA domain protein [Paecilomyces variotii No. 5]